METTTIIKNSRSGLRYWLQKERRWGSMYFRLGSDSLWCNTVADAIADAERRGELNLYLVSTPPHGRSK